MQHTRSTAVWMTAFAVVALGCGDDEGDGGAAAGAAGMTTGVAGTQSTAGSGGMTSGTAGMGTAGMGTAGMGTAGMGTAGTTTGTAGMGTAGMGTAGMGTAGMGTGGMGQEELFSFFITSANPGGVGSEVGGNLGGLGGADAYCQQLAEAVGSTRTWAAYLSADGVNARDRIGAGPWFNVDGAMVASSIENLHEEGGANSLDGTTGLDENGDPIPTGGPNQHDIMTGSLADGTAAPNNCGNWAVGDDSATTPVGHHNRAGGGAAPMSWNSAHESSGCSIDTLRSTGGEGLFYCFATD